VGIAIICIQMPRNGSF